MVIVAAGLLWLILKARDEKESESHASVPGRSIGRRITGWASLVTFAVALASLFFIGQSDSAWIVPVVFGGVTLVLFAANLTIARRLERYVSRASKPARAIGGAVRLDELTIAQSQLSDEERSFIDSRKWDPRSVPAQLYRSESGTLENPQLAEIVSMEEKSGQEREKYGVNYANDGDATRINLDEILRRRRANGN